MKLFISTALLFSFALISTGEAEPYDGRSPMSAYTEQANQCKDLKCVQDNMNGVDLDIITLIGKHMAYVKRSAELGGKSNTPSILATAGQFANQVGYSPFVARAVFSVITLQSNINLEK